MLDRAYSGPKLKRFLKHNYLPLLVSFESWACVAIIAKLAANPSVSSIAEGLRTMLLIGDPFMIHFWYMQMLLGIYLFIPILAGVLAALADGVGKLVGLAEAQADAALLVSDCDQCAEGEVLAALDDLGGAVDHDCALLELVLLDLAFAAVVPALVVAALGASLGLAGGCRGADLWGLGGGGHLIFNFVCHGCSLHK